MRDGVETTRVLRPIVLTDDAIGAALSDEFDIESLLLFGPFLLARSVKGFDLIHSGLVRHRL